VFRRTGYGGIVRCSVFRSIIFGNKRYSIDST
jgi:hypothetical protein